MVRKNDDYIKLACSQIAGEFLYSKFKNKEFRVVNNAINVDEYKFNQNSRMKVRDEIHIADNEYVVGHIGRFVEQKNHEFIIKIFEELYSQNNHITLVLVGDGPLYDTIKNNIKGKVYENKIKMLGIRKDIRNIIQAFDVFFMPSFYEGLPFVLIEAQAAGLPCIVSDNVSIEANILTKSNKYLSLNAH